MKEEENITFVLLDFWNLFKELILGQDEQNDYEY
jgi:hypothetical protein